MKSLLLPASLALAMLCSLTILDSATAADDDYEALVFKGEGDAKLNYRLLKPLSYDAKKKYPLVLFLHGAGERGDDNKGQLRHVAPTYAAKENREKYPCFVLAPQCPGNQQWNNVNWGAKSHTLPEKPSTPAVLTLQLIEQLQKQYSIDADRLYISGLSMGGYGTWDLIARHPDMFAAAVPMCGGADENTADKLTKLPIWNFHGDKDGAVPVSRSRNMIEALKKAGGNPKYTEYPGVGHDCWTGAMKEPELLPWLFAQKRGEKK
jgi:predicted peptidase